MSNLYLPETEAQLVTEIGKIRVALMLLPKTPARDANLLACQAALQDLDNDQVEALFRSSAKRIKRIASEKYVLAQKSHNIGFKPDGQ